ncbi:MAG TPA: hypothetical protein DCP36_12560 [Sporomusaceae bacterium]|jgi:CRP-like cAMP-binding protein|uniref:Crp/Fnr family transcriptional regulator n=1 Tax=Anaerospora sp. TaxID=1960278 RepID=UPI000EC51177|nr:Crp/Fnr family transcriptional regulator [Anaerospora sp.]HAK74197.1 hypothetical protein [Sporomusaceae bacterium]
MIEVLQKNALFSGKTSAEIETIVAGLQIVVGDFKKGELIFRSDQPADRIGILLQGSVAIEKNLANGKATPVFLRYPGEMFGEAAVFSRADTYPCNVISQSISQILFIPKAAMLTAIARDTALLSNFLQLFANKILELTIKTELLACDSIRQKIGFSLLYELSEPQPGKGVELPSSKKFWAESLDVSRPSLYRELGMMEREGLIRLAGKKIYIIDRAGLMEILAK